MTKGMNEPAWEGGVCFICDYWWVVLIVISVGLAVYFGQSYIF